MANNLTTAINVSSPDLSGIQDNPEKFFNNFFSVEFSVGSSDDALVAYFESYTNNPTAGRALAAAVAYTAKAQNIDPMVVLADFQKLSKGQLNSYLAAFLNFNRIPTSQIGIKQGTQTSPYITRSILP